MKKMIFILAATALSSSAQTSMDPEFPSFSPTGGNAAPWNLLINGAEKAAAGGTVVISGFTQDTKVYETGEITGPCTLTAASGTVTIGAQPISETTFRCVAYNTWLGAPTGLASSWGDTSRAAALRDYDWKDPDFIGFCEVWKVSYYNDYLRFIGGDVLSGFTYSGSPQHSGLVGLSKHTLGSKYRGVFFVGVGADFFSSKGWIRARIVKDGFGIWVFMAHAQADDPGATWGTTYDVRRDQLNAIRDDLNGLRNNPSYASDVFIVMGDLNVFGEDRDPTGSPDQNEYSTSLAAALGSEIGGGKDIARHFYPNPSTEGSDAFTITDANSLAKKHYPNLNQADSGRLDYIIGVGSKNNQVRLQPTKYEIIKGMAATPFRENAGDTSGATDRNLSDHYGIAGDFRIIRVAN